LLFLPPLRFFQGLADGLMSGAVPLPAAGFQLPFGCGQGGEFVAVQAGAGAPVAGDGVAAGGGSGALGAVGQTLRFAMPRCMQNAGSSLPSALEARPGRRQIVT
jgi:hypothetical protein